MFARVALCLTLCVLILRPAAAPAWEADGQEVDVELVLAVDVSLSVTPREMGIQRRGYAEAITSAEVMAAVRGGLLGRIAVSYVEWAGHARQRTVIDWTVIETEADARAFADTLLAAPGGALRRTSISDALSFAADSFDGNGFSGLRRVIDISGDGPNNSGRPVTEARDAAVAEGIIINGLPLMTNEGYGGRWHLPDLDRYYEDCVVGGPGAFVIPVREWDEFAAAIQRKLVWELVGMPPASHDMPDDMPLGRPGAARLWHAATSQTPPGTEPYDCLIGEKIWESLLRAP
jgi:hypothetical protein